MADIRSKQYHGGNDPHCGILINHNIGTGLPRASGGPKYMSPLQAGDPLKAGNTDIPLPLDTALSRFGPMTGDSLQLEFTRGKPG